MEYPTTSSCSGSGSSDTGISRYRGIIDSPAFAIVDEPMDPITVAIERLDAHGTPLRVNESHTSGIVVHIGLVSEDGTLDYELTETGERLLEGANSMSPEIQDGIMVASFTAVRIRRPGRFRFRVKAFNLYSTLPLPSSPEEQPTTWPATDSIFVETSDLLVVSSSL